MFLSQKETIKKLMQEVDKLHEEVKYFHEEIMKLKHPAKYRIGDTLDGGTVFEAKFHWHPKGSTWIYRIVKDGATHSIYQNIEKQ